MFYQYSLLLVLSNLFDKAQSLFELLSHFMFIFVCSVRKYSNFFDLDVTVFNTTCGKDCLFFYCILCPPLSKISFPYIFGFILFHLSICLYLCQYQSLLSPVALYFCLTSGRFMPPALQFYPRLLLAIWGLLWFIRASLVAQSVKNLPAMWETCA